MDSLKKREKKDKKEKKTIATKSSSFLNVEGISLSIEMRECNFAMQNLRCQGYHDKC
jgi:hypothetical protein